MTVIAACGHEIEDWPDGEFLFYMKEYHRGNRAVVYMNSCEECYKFFDAERVILKTEQERKDWLDGKLDY